MDNSDLWMGPTLKFFKLFLYALKFDMDRLFTFLDDMGEFLDSNMNHTPTLYIGSHPHFIWTFSDSHALYIHRLWGYPNYFRIYIRSIRKGWYLIRRAWWNIYHRGDILNGKKIPWVKERDRNIVINYTKW